MVNGLYTSGAGMMLALRKQELTANNMANALTTGYKTSQLATHATVETRRDVDQYMRQREEQRADSVEVDWSPGPQVTTGNALDVALTGDGFLAVSTAQGERYVRSASLQINADRELVDLSGARVLDTSGAPVVVPGDKVRIGADGRVYSDDTEVGTLRVVDFDQPYTLQQEGGNRWIPYAADPADPDPVAHAAATNVQVRTGVLEGSNANTVSQMVDMISQLRQYEADSRVLRAIDSTIDKAVNTVGRVG